ncbi:1,2-phenylacetyl-CoA epoxidase, subunit C [compost metagenome]
MIRLGDGSEISHQKIQQSLNDLWRFTAELFHADEIELQLAELGIAVDPRQLQAPWQAMVNDTLQQATLALPTEQAFRHGGKQGRHTEHLGPMLAEMQFLPRAYPNCSW